MESQNSGRVVWGEAHSPYVTILPLNLPVGPSTGPKFTHVVEALMASPQVGVPRSVSPVCWQGQGVGFGFCCPRSKCH